MAKRKKPIIKNKDLSLNAEQILYTSTAGEVYKPKDYIEPQKIEYIRASEPVLRQTIGKKRPHSGQLTLFDEILKDRQDLQETAIDTNISDIGVTLSVSERYALHSVQSLFSFKDYQNPIILSIPEYLEAFGANKYKTKRGYMEYSRAERDEALDALYALEKPIFIYWRRLKDKKYWKKKGNGKLEKTYEVITAIEPIIKIQKYYDNVTERESNKITSGEKLNGKLTHLKVEASNIFLYDSFVLFPEHIFKQIKTTYGKKVSKHFLTFVTLLYLNSKHKNYKPSFFQETLIDNLHLKYLEDTRQKKRLSQYLDEDYQKAKELGILTNYKKERTIRGEKITFELNKELFYQEKKKKLTQETE